MSEVFGWSGAGAFAILGSVGVGMALPGAPLAASAAGRLPDAESLLVGECGGVPAGQARLASASLITDEILIDLVPLSRLSAVSYVVDWPKTTAAFGRFPRELVRTRGNAEELLTLPADRIFLSEFNGSLPGPHLAAAGRCVARVRAPRSVEDVLGNVAFVGEIAGVSERARSLIAELDVRLSRLPVPGTGRRPRGMVLQGLMVYGAHTLQGDCLQRAGFDNVAAELGIENAPTLSAETLLRLPLEVVFVAAEVREPELAKAEHLPAGVLWEETEVWRHGRVVAVPEAWVGSLSHHSLLACEAYARYSGFDHASDARNPGLDHASDARNPGLDRASDARNPGFDDVLDARGGRVGF